MKYFAGLTTVAEIKAKFKELAFRHHPDLGGDTETMKIINAQYHDALQSANGQQNKGSDSKEHTYRYDEATEQAIAEKLDELLGLQLEEVEIAIIGTWLWVTGNTKPHKDQLGKNGIGLSWHTSRQAWYFNSTGHRAYSSNAYLESLARTYGVTNVENFKRKSKKLSKAH